MRYLFFSLIFLSFVNVSISAYCQVERGGIPRSFQILANQKSSPLPVEVVIPDMLLIQKQDYEDAMLEKSYRVGIEVPVSITSENSGQWDTIPGLGRIWRVSIVCNGAQGIGLSYNELDLPEGSDLYIYTPDNKYVIGAFTSNEVPPAQKFATRPIPGDEIVLEYFQPSQVKEKSLIDISGISYIYRNFEIPASGYKSPANSGPCEVNVNCTEGQNWEKQKQGVVKIQAKVGGGYIYCTGSLVNNTSQDFGRLLLTAAHCSKSSGITATVDDLKQWIFYFNYEYADCSFSATPTMTVVGATQLAKGDKTSDIGSDFLLLNLNSKIPASYHPYYCGWDAGNGNSSSGVCIHHPEGDVKKISTYTSFLVSGTWGSTPNTHWLVRFAETTNGWGVTEGGSSGGPLFDNEGFIIGTLTGGQSGCDNTNGEDSFGKLSYSWKSNGTTADMQLQPWLDPGNILEATGILKMHGTFNDKLTVANFTANKYVIPIGGTIDFQDLSEGLPTHWHWYFQGGKPNQSTEQNPAGILFDRFGSMNVKLVVNNEYNSDSIVKEAFIDVRAIVSPNPSSGVINILSDKSDASKISIEVFDYLGKIAQRFEYSNSTSESYSVTLPNYGNVFFIRMLQGDKIQTHKVIVVH